MAEHGGTDRVAVVTGGASGIGLATACHLAAVGWRVAAFDRDERALAAASAEAGPAVAFAPLDVTDEAAIEAALESTSRLGRIAGVVNSAGIAADIPAFETGADLFRRILDANVVGSFLVAKAAARRMMATGGGAIVNLASVSGLRGSKGRVAYGASKGAVVTMTQVLANEWARHEIRVNAVAPGPVETPLIKRLHTEADRALWSRYVPMRRYADPSEIARVIAFLLGPDASYMTGEVVAVDGGFRGAGIIMD